MATEIDPKLVTKLAGIVKKEPGNSERFYSEKSGIAMGQILRYLVKAELEADPSLKIPATGPSIAKARDEQGLRWPRIAARAGVSESKAKELYEEKTGKSAGDSYTGRGRNWAGTETTKKSGAGSATSGRRGAAANKKSAAKKTGTSGRRGAKTGAAASKKTAASAGRRGTRASAADPK